MPGVEPSTLQNRRRSLLTAAVSGGLLLALWFVPSADVTPEGLHRTGSGHGVGQSVERNGAVGTAIEHGG